MTHSVAWFLFKDVPMGLYHFQRRERWAQSDAASESSASQQHFITFTVLHLQVQISEEAVWGRTQWADDSHHRRHQLTKVSQAHSPQTNTLRCFLRLARSWLSYCITKSLSFKMCFPQMHKIWSDTLVLCVNKMGTFPVFSSVYSAICI